MTESTLVSRESNESERDAVLVVEQYLLAMEDRDLSVAASYWGSSVEIIGVGGSRYSDLSTFVANSAKRYQFVAKRRIVYHQWAQGDQVHVGSQGTLYGRLLDGTKFQDVRYLDLFTLKRGRISRQEIFNDFGAALDRLLS